MRSEHQRDDDLQRALELFEAIKHVVAAFDRAPPGVLALVHERMDDLFLEVTEPRGRRDNVVEQRLVGLLWAELEEILSDRA